MDTIGPRIAAAAASLLEGFSPSAWAPLPSADALRVLLADGARTLVATAWPPESEAAASAERIAASVLAPLLSEAPFALTAVLASGGVPGRLLDREGAHTLMLTEPMPGTPLSTDMFARQPDLVDSLAEAVALIHGADPGPVADAGLVVEESAELRERMLSDLDSAAETGRVPATLLQRWEEALEDVAAWRFLPVPVHANLGPDALWAEEGRISGIGELSRLRVGDPAADLAAVSSLLTPEDFERFFRAYRRARGAEDPGLRVRVGFHSEITVLDWLLAAVAAQDPSAVDDAVALLEALAEITDAEDADASGEPHAGAAGAHGAADPEGSGAPVDAGTDDETADPGETADPADTAGDAGRTDADPHDRPEAASPEPGGRSSDGVRLLARDAEAFQPLAAPAYDEDGIGTERLSELEDDPRGN